MENIKHLPVAVIEKKYNGDGLKNPEILEWKNIDESISHGTGLVWVNEDNPLSVAVFSDNDYIIKKEYGEVRLSCTMDKNFDFIRIGLKIKEPQDRVFYKD